MWRRDVTACRLQQLEARSIWHKTDVVPTHYLGLALFNTSSTYTCDVHLNTAPECCSDYSSKCSSVRGVEIKWTRRIGLLHYTTQCSHWWRSVILRHIIISINQSNQIYIAPYVASESEARVGRARRSVHVHCKQCQTVLSLKVVWKYWEVQQIYRCRPMTVSSRLKGR